MNLDSEWIFNGSVHETNSSSRVILTSLLKLRSSVLSFFPETGTILGFLFFFFPSKLFYMFLSYYFIVATISSFLVQMVHSHTFITFPQWKSLRFSILCTHNNRLTDATISPSFSLSYPHKDFVRSGVKDQCIRYEHSNCNTYTYLHAFLGMWKHYEKSYES